MANPYVNKVVSNGVTKVDLTADTVTPSMLFDGLTAHDASGAPIEGSMADGDPLGYGNGSYLVGMAKVGTGYVWTEYAGDVCVAGKSVVGEASAA